MKTVNGSTIMGKILRTKQSASGMLSKRLEKREFRLNDNDKTHNDNLINLSKYNQTIVPNCKNPTLDENARINDSEQAKKTMDAIKSSYKTAPYDIIEAQSKTKIIKIMELLQLGGARRI